MRAVIYARYSSDSQRDESIDGQIRECKEYAERNDITVIGTYIDRALSAKTDNRPDFQRMIKDSSKGLFDVVIVWKLDRFARNRYDSAHYKSILKKNGVKVISAKEAIAEDSTGILLESLLEGYAEFYSVELSEKIHRGQTENALKGLANGGTPPLGYLLGDDKKYHVDPLTAPIVQEVFTRYSNGETVIEIVKSLNNRGLRTRLNNPFNYHSFSKMLKNRKYIGEYKYRDIVIEDAIPPIISKELFDTVQKRIEKNKHSPAACKAEIDYLLSTKLFCGYCNRMMVGETGTSKTKQKYHYYKCNGVKRIKDCSKKTVKKEHIEDFVFATTLKLLLEDNVLDRITKIILAIQEEENTLIPILEKQLSETESGITNIINAIQQGLLSPTLKQRLDELESTKEQLSISLIQEKMKKPVLTEEMIHLWLRNFRMFSVDNHQQKKILIDTFIHKVLVYDNKLVIVYNHQETPEEYPFNNDGSSDLTPFTPPYCIFH